jgi:Sigma-70 factor, region 1.2
VTAPPAQAGVPHTHETLGAPELLVGYLAHIGRGRLLTHEEEVELSERPGQAGSKAGKPGRNSSRGTSDWS